MKFFTTIAVIICAVMVTVGCSKEDDAESLNGTTWVGSEYGESIKIIFGANSFECIFSYDGDTDIIYGTYVYTPPIVAMTAEGYTEYASISGNVMDFDGTTLIKY